MFNSETHYQFIAPKDLESLQNLSKIPKDTRSYIDVDTNGCVSNPYAVGRLSSIWRLSHIGFTYVGSSNIPKIESLMERSLLALDRGDAIGDLISSSLEGLANLKATYQENSNLPTIHNKPEVVSNIDQIVHFFKAKLEQFENSELTRERHCSQYTTKEGQWLENSIALARGFSASLTGINYLREKIESFIRIANLESDEIELFRKILSQFEETSRAFHLKNDYYPPEGVSEDGWAKEKELYPLELLDKLDQMSPEDQRNIGVYLSSDFINQSENNGHTRAVVICKNEQDVYVITDVNAGDLIFDENTYTKYQLNWHQPSAKFGRTVFEFGPFSKEETLDFLKRASEFPLQNKDLEQIFENMNNLWGPVFAKRQQPRTPPRRLQSSGNCTIRTPTESIIFSLQKAGEPSLANKFLHFARLRSEDSPDIEEVLPLLELS